MKNNMTKSQIEQLEMETRSCVACTIPKEYSYGITACALYDLDFGRFKSPDWKGREVEIGKRGKVLRDRNYNTAGYYGIKGKNHEWV